MGTVRIKAGKVRPLWAGHPWVFAQAIARIDGAPGPGDPVRVVDPEGKYLGSGFYSPKSAIPVRLMTHRPDEALDGVAIGRRLEAALSLRKTLGLPSDENTGYRLVNAEGDHLPGLIVDVFDDTAVVQLGTVGMKSREEEIFAQVQRVVGAKTVIEMGADHQRGEGFISETRIARGEDRDALRFQENGFAFDIPRTLSHKTGYYFDQRANRLRVGQLAEGKRVLDAYSYLGGFALAAARGGASEVVAIERSAPAVAAAASIAHANGQHISYHRDDVKKALPRLQPQKERFDIVIVDPPKLAPTRNVAAMGPGISKAAPGAGQTGLPAPQRPGDSPHRRWWHARQLLLFRGASDHGFSSTADHRGPGCRRSTDLARDRNPRSGPSRSGRLPRRPLPRSDVSSGGSVKDLASLDADGVCGVLFDVDDTVTREGVVEQAAFAAMHRLHQAGFVLVAVTGRPLGWADVIVRQWPVDMALGENGAGWLRRRGHVVTEGYFCTEAERDVQAALLKRIQDDVLARFPDLRMAEDQRARRCDLAFDVREHASLSDGEIAALEQLIEAHGARALTSSVHCHALAGDWNKASGIRRALEANPDLPRADAPWVFVGDSANDADAFGYFDRSVGVANLRADESNLQIKRPLRHRSARTNSNCGRLYDRILNVQPDCHHGN